MPGLTANMKCEGCGRVMVTGIMKVVLLADNPDDAEAERPIFVPWEDRVETGRWPAYRATLKMSLLQPGELGKRLGRYAMQSDAYWFAAVVWCVIYGQLLLIGAALALFDVFSITRGFVAMLPCLAATVLLPLLVPYVVIIFAGPAHVTLKLTGGCKGGLDRTVCSLLYAQGPMLAAPLVLIPLVELAIGLVLAIWYLVAASTILREAQGVSGARAAMAVTMWPAAACAIVGYVYSF